MREQGKSEKPGYIASLVRATRATQDRDIDAGCGVWSTQERSSMLRDAATVDATLMRGYRLTWTALMIVAVVFAGATLVFTYLASLGADGSGCRGQYNLAGYQRLEFFMWPIVAMFSLFPFLVGRNEEKIAQIFADHNEPIVVFRPFYLTHGMLVIYATLGTFVALIGFAATQSIVRYAVISEHCRATASGTHERSDLRSLEAPDRHPRVTASPSS
jgi:hypothetical protein